MALYIGSDEVTGGAIFTYNGVQVKQLDVKETPSSTPVTVWKYNTYIISIPTALHADVIITNDTETITVSAGNTYYRAFEYSDNVNLTIEVSGNNLTQTLVDTALFGGYNSYVINESAEITTTVTYRTKRIFQENLLGGGNYSVVDGSASCPDLEVSVSGSNGWTTNAPSTYYMTVTVSTLVGIFTFTDYASRPTDDYYHYDTVSHQITGYSYTVTS